MILQYVAVFDPSRSSGEDDMRKQLLLYHSFADSETSLNDKLGRIGVIQGIWSITESLNSGDNVTEKVIELEDGVILTIKVEGVFFICLCISNDTGCISKDNFEIPYQLYMTHIRLCYQFFTLEFGKLGDIEDSGKLTDLLNEHFVSFWNDIVLRPEGIMRKGIIGLWPDSCKMAELDFDSNEESWESLINQNILLEPDSYLGIKDILVYHLPNQGVIPQHRKSNIIGYKTYGLVRNFSSDLTITAQLSNWIYHKHAIYDTLSSHVLAGNTHYKEAPEEASSHSDNGNENGEPSLTSPANNDLQTSLQEQGRYFLHNLTLPITFAYDAMQEVSSTAGISNSVSLFMDYVPKWGRNRDGEGINNGTKQSTLRGSRYGYLISPLCSQMLPESYKVKRVSYTDRNTNKNKSYNLLFWYYDDVLAVIVSEPNFTKIWDTEYLQDLSYKLRLSMESFYKAVLKSYESHDKKDKKDSFAYIVLDEERRTVKSSIPLYYDTDFQKNESSPLQIVINGVDNLFNTTVANDGPITEGGKWGIGIMGGLFGSKVDVNKRNPTTRKESLEFEKSYQNFLDVLPQEKKWELQVQIMSFLQTFKNSQKKTNIVEERLSKLNNGILCYIKEDQGYLVLVIKNWYDDEELSEKKPKTLFMSLGKDVTTWWNNNNV